MWLRTTVCSRGSSIMFLHRIAQTFYTEYGADIRKFTFVFPNRRAGLFFRKYLMEIIDKPIFSPEIITINECFFNASTRKVADRTAELFRLYRIYRNISKTDESFDAFVFWGEMLLSDFNDVDKFEVDAPNLFRNVTALKEIEMSDDYLTDEQRKAIAQFWNHFLPDIKSTTKKEFIAIWKVLLPLYEQFRIELLDENTATEGMIFREVTDLLKENEMPDYFVGKNFVFVGFNALNKTEKNLFIELQKRGQADFYWDYEADVLRDPDNQASVFFKENTLQFLSKLTIDRKPDSFNEKSFDLIAIPSSVGQTKEVYNLLNDLYSANSKDNDWIKTAVVLPDESLLVPLLHSLPENIENVNVTMGFPLKASPVSGLLENIFDLQRRINSRGQFYHIVVSNILNHQYINMLCGGKVQNIHTDMVKSNAIYVDISTFEDDDILKTIFTQKKSPDLFLDYLLEVLQKLNLAWQDYSDETGKHHLECDFLYQYYVAINRMNEVMKSAGEFEVSMDTLIRLIRQLIGGVSIPFEGEPLNGLQVMGMLETRGLDFENLIICSFNEGVFPKKNSSNSFIPNSLRSAFGMPTFEYHDAISAYNFYRLIQRTKRLFFLYDSRSEGMKTGEVSRFVHQLHYHYGVDFKKINVAYDVDFSVENVIEVQKTPEIMEKLRTFTLEGEECRALSASSLNTYINCPLQFYFSNVEKIREQDEVQEDIEASMFGTILHKTMELIYEPFVGKMVQKIELDELRKNQLIVEKTIKRAFTKEFFKKGDNEEVDFELEGKYLLNAKVIRKFVEKILEVDADRTPFKYIQSEAKMFVRFPINENSVYVNLKGSIDRVDEKEGMIRILDYKTGSDLLKFKSLEHIFERNNKDRPKAVFQTLLYCLLYEMDNGTSNLIPEVLKIKELFKSNFETKLILNPQRGVNEFVENFIDFKEEFVGRLTETIEELFDPEVPFVQCGEIELCKYCAFKTICRRFVKENNY